MSNDKKYGLYTILQKVGVMFCTGAIIQAFLLQIGLSERQIYVYDTLIQAVQVAVMFAMIFFSDKMKRVKWVSAITPLALILLIAVFIFGALNPSVNLKPYSAVVMLVASVAYVGFGMKTVVDYCLPYHVMDMKEYGKIMGVCHAISGGCTFGLSFLHSFVISRFDYFYSMLAFFVLAIVCLIFSSVFCVKMKELEKPQEQEKRDFGAVFKKKNTYILLVPNFTRGIATGIVNVITVIAFAVGILGKSSSSYVNIAIQFASLFGNLIFAYTYKKFGSRNLVLISTLLMCVLLPFTIAGKSLVVFVVVFAIMYFFKIVNDTSIPVLVTEIIPKEEIGAYTSIRMLIFTAGSAVGALLVSPISALIGYTGLLIFALAMQMICGISYYVVAKIAIKTKGEEFKNES